MRDKRSVAQRDKKQEEFPEKRSGPSHKKELQNQKMKTDVIPNKTQKGIRVDATKGWRGREGEKARGRKEQGHGIPAE